MKIKTRSHKFDINRLSPRLRHKHTKYKASRYDDLYM